MALFVKKTKAITETLDALGRAALASTLQKAYLFLKILRANFC